jgi:hypothetical protein
VASSAAAKARKTCCDTANNNPRTVVRNPSIGCQCFHAFARHAAHYVGTDACYLAAPCKFRTTHLNTAIPLSFMLDTRLQLPRIVLGAPEHAVRKEIATHCQSRHANLDFPFSFNDLRLIAARPAPLARPVL